ncbi:MAG TPA: MFS transporter [Burkholderiales bacterium]|nr:MFS transporter [Burkholderiales bacterium]
MPAFRKPGPAAMLVCASLILTLSLGTRHSFGLFLQPMSMANGWGREVFGFAVAVQNLLWGLSQPATGMLADRFGARRVLFTGGLLFALGLVFMANSTTALGLTLAIGVFVGLGMSCTSFNIVFGALGRAYSAEKRSVVLGISSAAGSFGQFALLPLALFLISGMGWYAALIALSLGVALMMPASFGVADRGYHGTPAAGAGVSLKQALAEAFRHKGFWLLGVGYFACGFQVVFIGTHFPAFLMDQGLTARDGTISLALIGLFNIFGSYLAGQLGGRFSKTYLLSGVYAARGVAIALLISFPLTPASAYLFAATMGFLWLGTVPLTNGVVAGIFGVKHLAMLSGFVFFFHQLGSFFGGWLGGYIFDHTGSYRIVWLIAIALSVISVVVNLPIDERPVTRPVPA